ncbi:MAG: amidohydrolase, partial [Bacteroidia bacterium]|nr:amidohydrolase [Bacteroidia bacterium]
MMTFHSNIQVLKQGFFYFIFSITVFYSAYTQSVPTPAPKNAPPMVIRNGTIHVGNGKILEKTDLYIENGKIISIGKSLSVSPGIVEINANGKHIYPGLIALSTNIGLLEIEAVRATRDFAETGELNPNARTIIAYNTDSRVTPTIRSNGVLLAQIAPEGGLVSGQSSVVELDAWNWEDAAYLIDDALHIYWPDLTIRTWPWSPKPEEQRKSQTEAVQKLKKLFDDAQNYQIAKASGKTIATNLKLEAMLPYISTIKPVYIHAQEANQIEAAIHFADEYNLKMVLVGGADAHFCIPHLKKHKIPVVLTAPHNLPLRDDEPIDLPYVRPKLLKDAGILVAIHLDKEMWQQRNLMFQAGTAAAY